LFALLPTVILGYTTSRYVRETAEDLCCQILASICQKEAEITTQWLRSREEELRTGARKMASTKTMPTIEGCKRLVYFNDRGQVIADTGENPGHHLEEAKQIVVGLAKERRLGDDRLFVSLNPVQRAVQVLVPIKSESGEGIRGFFWAEFDCNYLDTILSPVAFPQKTSGTIKEPGAESSYLKKLVDFQFGYHPRLPHLGELKTFIANEGSAITIGANGKNQQDTGHILEVAKSIKSYTPLLFSYENKSGEKMIVAGQKLSGNLVLLVEARKGDITRGVYTQGFSMIFLALFLVLMLTVPLSVLVTRKITEPLLHLTKEAEKIAGGEFGRQIAINHPGEIGVLASSFKEMSSRLQDFYEQLSQQIKELGEQKCELARRNEELELLQKELALKQAELLEANRLLKKMAYIDELTQVTNRRSLIEEAKREVARALRSKQPIGVVMIDVDNFKMINDVYGHDQGDAVLREVAATLKKNARECDIVGRYGGDEFAVILPGTELTGAVSFGKRLLGAFGEQFCNGKEPRVSVSIGVTSWEVKERQGEKPEHLLSELLQKADIALLEAKRKGRNRVVVYQEPLTNQNSQA
jgi:diguanylate cyclase (GGDEF)-like protein